MMHDWKRKQKISCLFGLICLCLSGCRPVQKAELQVFPDSKADELQILALPEYPQEPVYKSDEERWEEKDEKRQLVNQNFTNALEDFSIKTASALLTGESENVIYSPISLYYALALAAEGASGRTQEEFLQLLGYEEIDRLSEDAQHYFEFIYHVPNDKNNKPNEYGEYAAESRYTLSIANSLWADESLNLKKDFLNKAEHSYYSEVYQGNMQDEMFAQNMSEWVRKKTNGVLVPTIDENAKNTLLTLLNTVYFYDEWLDRFDKEQTQEDIFFSENGSTPTVDFMNRTMASHSFRRGECFVSSALSLKNGTMEFYLPNEGVSIYDLIDTPEKMEKLLNDSGEKMMGEVVWKIPKFSYGASIDLMEYLQSCGIEQAFAADADFSSISDISPLFVSKIKQDAHIGIDENGVEAAAFTELSWAGAALPNGRAEMILNRPFFYVIRNKGQIVFMGICKNM